MANSKKPASLHKLHGTYRNDRHLSAEFAPEPGIPDAPSCLIGEALVEWNRVTNILHNQQLISELDRAALTQYVILWQQLSDEPETFTAALHNQLRCSCTALGFSPLTRHKIARLKTPEEQEEDPWGDFARGT